MKGCCVLLVSLLLVGFILTSGCSDLGNQPETTSTVQTAAEVTAETTAAAEEDVQPRGVEDPDFIVDVSEPESIEPGTTILPDNHDPENPRIIEVNRLGEIVWDYPLPDDLKGYTNPGWDVEPLSNGNILTVLPRKGVYEISPDKQVVWSYLDPKVSHDADRLENGNTLVVFGSFDTQDDAQVKEVDPQGNIVWSWYAKDVFDISPYSSISDEGWTHTNAVTRLSNGNTLVSLRNFDIVAEIDPSGELVKTIGEGLFDAQHDPLVLSDGNILLANHNRPQEAIEIDSSGNVVWEYKIKGIGSYPVRDANLLSNGNILITCSDRIIEVTPGHEVVWQFRLADGPFTEKEESSGRGFYKAERISS